MPALVGWGYRIWYLHNRWNHSGFLSAFYLHSWTRTRETSTFSLGGRTYLQLRAKNQHFSRRKHDFRAGGAGSDPDFLPLSSKCMIEVMVGWSQIITASAKRKVEILTPHFSTSTQVLSLNITNRIYAPGWYQVYWAEHVGRMRQGTARPSLSVTHGGSFDISRVSTADVPGKWRGQEFYWSHPLTQHSWLPCLHMCPLCSCCFFLAV